MTRMFRKNESKRLILSVIFTVFLILASLHTIGCSSKAPDSVSDGYRSEENAGQDQRAAEADPYVGTKDSEMERRIIQNARLVVRVPDVREALDNISTLSKNSNGYTVSSHLNKNGEIHSGQIIIKVPQENMSVIINEITGLGELIDQSTSTQDVTEEYHDSQARLKVLNKKEERLISFMDQAKVISDIVALENELTKVRTDIEVLQGRLKYLENATAYSQIQVNLQESNPQKLTAPQGIMGKAVQGLVTSTNHMVNFMSGLLVGLFVIAPWAVLLFLLFLAYRYYRNKRRPPEV